MTIELKILAWGCVLGIAHIIIAAQAATAQYGARWGLGSREGEVPPPRPVVGRLQRAQRNYFETFPVAAAAILIDAAAGIGTHWTAVGAILWLAARVVYVPVYAAGIPVVRTLLFLAGVVGIFMVLWPALF